MLDDREMLADARTAASLFTAELIAADTAYGVIEGCAGAILGLLKAYRSTGDSAILSRAVACGEHLLPWLRAEIERRAGGNAATPLLNGMSHGLAGFAYALTSLARAAGRPDLCEIAARCITVENEPSRYPKRTGLTFGHLTMPTLCGLANGVMEPAELVWRASARCGNGRLKLRFRKQAAGLSFCGRMSEEPLIACNGIDRTLWIHSAAVDWVTSNYSARRHAASPAKTVRTFKARR